MPNTSQKRFDTRQLEQNEENQERYREQIKQETDSSAYVAAQQENKWEKLKDNQIRSRNSYRIQEESK